MKFLAGIIAATASACEDGLHADPNNCAQFYQCANGHQYPMQECPEGLLFNAEEEYCDWPENVDCSVSKWSCFKDCVGRKWWNPMVRHKCWKNCNKGEMIQTDMYKGFTGKVERKSCEEGIHKHPFRCDAYYQCGEGGYKFDDQFCPSGLYYNEEKAYCDWPENVQCKTEKFTCYKRCIDDSEDASLLDHIKCGSKCL